MILFSGVFLGLLAGTLCRGKFLRLTTLRGLWFAILPLFFTPIMRFYPQIPLFPKALIISLSYLSTLLFVFYNRKYLTAAILLGLGTLSNYIVIAANGFRMPVSVKALEVYSTISAQALVQKRADYFIAENGANLMFLGDVTYLPVPTIGGFMSVGDVLLAFGMFLLILMTMRDKNAVLTEKDLDKKPEKGKQNPS